MLTMTIPIKSENELKIIKEAGRLAAQVMADISVFIAPGISTEYLDELAQNIMLKIGCRPAFKGYKGYPKSICVSVDNEIVHGIPSKNKVLKEGSIVSIDLGVEYRGFYGDLAATFGVGEISPSAQRLIKITKTALYKGIEKAKSGNRLGDISYAIQNYVETHGYSVVRNFVGHGIGRSLHEEPEIPNFGTSDTGPVLKEGMVLAIEPMVNEGSFEVKILDDGWTAVTKDGKLSSHFEHTVLVRKNRAQILTEF